MCFLENLFEQLESVDILFCNLCWIIHTISAYVLMSTNIIKYKCMICFDNEHYRITPFFG